ncbi:hypothetical protein BaRGS_00009081 [Batillaria attramentaria]|uniref:Uncharacterized protein n=1 Tax=Batillaria attramentaria TaxID=370345 RepID=A0ABD0LK09_9CAEN
MSLHVWLRSTPMLMDICERTLVCFSHHPTGFRRRDILIYLETLLATLRCLSCLSDSVGAFESQHNHQLPPKQNVQRQHPPVIPVQAGKSRTNKRQEQRLQDWWCSPRFKSAQ